LTKDHYYSLLYVPLWLFSSKGRKKRKGIALPLTLLLFLKKTQSVFSFFFQRLFPYGFVLLWFPVGIKKRREKKSSFVSSFGYFLPEEEITEKVPFGV
jgi:hypothetical protein